MSASPRAICNVLLDPRDPLQQSERTQGFTADLVYVKGEVLAYVGSIQNVKDLHIYIIKSGLTDPTALHRSQCRMTLFETLL